MPARSSSKVDAAPEFGGEPTVSADGTVQWPSDDPVAAAPPMAVDPLIAAQMDPLSVDAESLEAVEARAKRHAAQGPGYPEYDPLTMQRVVEVPNGRGSTRKVLRPVASKEDVLKNGVMADYYQIGVGWVRNGTKRETDIDARREDNVFTEDD